MSHATGLNASCCIFNVVCHIFTCVMLHIQWVMSHIYMCHVTWMNKSYHRSACVMLTASCCSHVGLGHVAYSMSHVTFKESRDIQWVMWHPVCHVWNMSHLMSHIMCYSMRHVWLRHVAYAMSHVTYIYASCHMNGWVMLHLWVMSHTSPHVVARTCL